jgi:hypothetical protein
MALNGSFGKKSTKIPKMGRVEKGMSDAKASLNYKKKRKELKDQIIYRTVVVSLIQA